MKLAQFEILVRAQPPSGPGSITIWLNSGQQMTGETFSYDVSGVLYLTQSNGDIITVAMDQVAAYQTTPLP